MFKKKEKLTIKLWMLSFASSVLLSIPFMMPHLGLVALIAFIPLLAAEQLAAENKKKHFFIIYYCAFFLWNIITTYWVYYATPGGAAAAILLNSLQMAIIFALFRWMKTLTKGFLPYIFFIITWLAWEHSYFTWAVNWPWLVLGNSFATSIKSIQWYEYTGSLGGSLWILLANTLLFRIIYLKLTREKILVSVCSLVVIIIIPITFSHILYFNYKEVENSRNFTVLQPNIDPFNDKFAGLTQDEQDRILVKLMVESNTGTDRLILAPETFIGTRLNEQMPQVNASFSRFYQIINEYNAVDSLGRGRNINMILGAVTDKIYNSPASPTETATNIEPDMWYDRFNAAVFMDSRGNYDFYHKSKLVILAESNPFKKGPFKFIDKLVSGMAGGIGNFGTQPQRSIFTTPDSVKIGTAICYESIFGDYYREYVLKGANVMGIITNDGWWRNTAGHRHHLSYASLRAIETRRSIARSANTGISAFINQRGDIITQTPWWTQCYLNGSLNLNEKITVFVEHGDMIGRLSRFLFFLFLLMGGARMISKKYIVKEIWK